MMVIGGRPGTGKTTIKDQLIREAFRLNPGLNLRALEFSLEMMGKTSAIRGMSAHTGKSYKQLCSADNGGKDKLSDDDYRACAELAEEMKGYPIDVVEAGPTVQKMEAIVDAYMKYHSKQGMIGDVPTVIYRNTIITIDHSLLLEVNKKAGEKSKNDMLYNLGTTLTRLKRKYPIAFIVLSQLNRSIDHPDRQENGKYGNYVLDSDIFGADALLQHADNVIGLNIPGKQKITQYGPERYLIKAEHLVMHFLKARNGETGLGFFNHRFKQILEKSMNLSLKH
jgi:replicative DNA helicase